MKNNNILDKPILALSDSDVLTFRHLVEGGVLITGGLGSGKSSTSGKALAMGMLRAGLGGLILTVKSDETLHWKEYIDKAGRSKDLMVFSAESGLSFDPLAYTWNQPGRGAGYIESIIELFTTLMAIGKPETRASSESRYFELAVEELMRATLVMQSLAAEPISITSMNNIIISLPTEPEQIETAEWQKSSSAAKLVEKLKERFNNLTDGQREDLENAINFALEAWPNEDPRTRSNVLSTWTGMASKFTYDPLRRMFCSGRYDFTPEQVTHERKLILLDVPVLEFGREASRICQILIKIVFQRAWLRHQYVPGCCNGGFLFQDEFSMLLHRLENHFHTVVRSSAIAPICLTTNILNLASEEFGENEPGSKTYSFLGNLTVKIFHHQSDIKTRQYAADLIGQEYRYLDNYSAGGSISQAHANFGGHKHLAHIVEPVEFSRLLKPDGENPYAEAIVYTGSVFNATKTNSNPKGNTYLRVVFSRDI
ncbi:MAG: hypothetical protein JO323_17830 [Acidobacteriia bacterium]|nr:hypothetical protein [Terriglobia bacterium]